MMRGNSVEGSLFARAYLTFNVKRNLHFGDAKTLFQRNLMSIKTR